MILDWRKDWKRARLYDVIDAETGNKLDDLPIFRADDEAGICHVFREEGPGQFLLDAEGDDFQWYERRGPIRFTLKPEYPSEEEGIRRYEEEYSKFRLGLENQLEAV